MYEFAFFISSIFCVCLLLNSIQLREQLSVLICRFFLLTVTRNTNTLSSSKQASPAINSTHRNAEAKGLRKALKFCLFCLLLLASQPAHPASRQTDSQTTLGITKRAILGLFVVYVTH